jgi:hypothetical protein
MAELKANSTSNILTIFVERRGYILNQTLCGLLLPTTANHPDHATGHDGFFYLDDLRREELLDIRETALETRERACKVIHACERRLDACASNR